MSEVSPGMQLCMDSEGYAKDLGNGWVIAYWDAYGNCWTIAFGSTGPDIKKGTTWTRDHAVLRLQQGWNNAQAGALRASPILHLDKYRMMLEAVTDFCYNCGVGRYQSSTMRRYINQERMVDASNEFPKWKYAKAKVVPGLVVRRSRERALFLTPVASAPVASATPAVVPDQSAPIDVALDDPLPTASTDSTPERISNPMLVWLANACTQLAGYLQRSANRPPPNTPTSRGNDHH